MCCLYGILCYGEPLNTKVITDLVTELGISATERGTDATGLAYVHKNNVTIQKAPKSAYDFGFKLPCNVYTVMGHTRMTTQGNGINNYNNHPFYMSIGNQRASLAHNGMIYNDKELRKSNNLSSTKVETDSYIAVQLLETNDTLDMTAIKNMCELLEGSYCFSILDDDNNLYLVKGNNPLYILHHKELKMYLYASTSQVLWRGIVNSTIFNKHFNPINNSIDEISIHEGQIIKISNTGLVAHENFTIKERMLNLYSYQSWLQQGILVDEANDEYTEQLKWFAASMGVDEDIVDTLLDEGFGYDEIEEFIYDESIIQLQ